MKGSEVIAIVGAIALGVIGLLILSFVISSLIFAPVEEVPSIFLTSLITVDSLSVAVIGFVFPLAIRTLKVEETMKQLEGSNESLKPPEEFKMDMKLLYTWAAIIALVKILSFGLSAILLIAPIIYISPFAISILFTLGAMVRNGNNALVFSLYGFTSMVFGYLLIVATMFLLIWLLWQVKLGEIRTS